MKKKKLNELSEAAALMGRRGGKKTALRGKEYFKKIQQIGVEARKKNQEAKQKKEKEKK